ncbi:MAG: Flp pilus assembly complex ATPase component TadA [Deltaproteobacteria bacterium]|nr:Flp pilus assembly complex ATPase component TadA [Deltaproteobacteria bacterium]
MEPLALLGMTELFSGLPPAHQNQLAQRLQRIEAAAGAVIVKQGDPGDALYLIESGRVAVLVRDENFGLDLEVARLGAGECFGEMALLTGEPRTATCSAIDPTVVHALRASVFQAVIGQAPAVAASLCAVLARRLSQQSREGGLSFVNLSHCRLDPAVYGLVPETVLRKHRLLPLTVVDGVLTVAAVDPTDSVGIDELRRFVRGLRVKPVAVSATDYERAVRTLGPARTSIAPAAAPQPRIGKIELVADEERPGQAAVPGPEIVELVTRLLSEGIALGASDIHIEPEREEVAVRFRVHGTLQKRAGTIPRSFHRGLVARIKVLGRMDISEQRIAQDGRISLAVDGRNVDLRVSSIPTKFGEKVVMRVLDAAAGILDLAQIILPDQLRQIVRQMFYRPNGVVLVTGPTGSGKSTTLYSALTSRLSPQIHAVTVEDPIEYHLPGVTQIQVRESAGMTFSSILRAVFRQDSDVVMVGETRDAETARLCFEAGITGHLVLTSLHTNDTVSAVLRLFEMGIQPFLLGNALVGVLHQRLVRRTCPSCAAPFEYHPQVIETLRVAGALPSGGAACLVRGQGCAACDKTGFRGRIAAFEVLVVSDAVRQLVCERAPVTEIRAAAAKGSFVSLASYSSFLLQKGLTVPPEVIVVLPSGSSGGTGIA